MFVFEGFKPIVALVPLREALRHAAALGIRWEPTRFGSYVKTIESMSAPSKTFMKRYKSDEATRRLVFESFSQSHQLVFTAGTWSTLDREPLAATLKHVFRGSPMEADAGDRPRNTLLELVTAAFLQLHGFHIELQEGREDVTLRLDGVGSGAAECKRPASRSAFSSNCADLRRQLKNRREKGSAFGIGVLGIDRLSDFYGDTYAASTEAEADSALEEVSRSLAHPLFQGDHRLRDEAHVGLIVLSGAILLREGPSMMPFTRVTPVPLRPSKQLPAALDAVFLSKLHEVSLD